MKILAVIDMQNDFVDGALGTAEAQAIVPRVCEKIRGFDGAVLYTRDTHGPDYLQTQEGRFLPAAHCVKGTHGYALCPGVAALSAGAPVIDKPAFGSRELAERLAEMHREEALESVTFIGLCTDICVISNSLLVKAFLPEVPIIVDASCCAGVTPESHRRALECMKVCQIVIENNAAD